MYSCINIFCTQIIKASRYNLIRIDPSLTVAISLCYKVMALLGSVPTNGSQDTFEGSDLINGRRENQKHLFFSCGIVVSLTSLILLKLFKLKKFGKENSLGVTLNLRGEVTRGIYFVRSG